MKHSSSPEPLLIFTETYYIFRLQKIDRICHNIHCHFNSAKVTLLSELVIFLLLTANISR
jgi:hypothetical protein